MKRKSIQTQNIYFSSHEIPIFTFQIHHRNSKPNKKKKVLVIIIYVYILFWQVI